MNMTNKTQRALLLFVLIATIVVVFIFTQWATVQGGNPIVLKESPPPDEFSSLIKVNPPTPIPGRNGEDILVEITQEPRIVTERIDKAMDLADKDKFAFIVRRSNGKYAMFLIPANLQGGERELMNLLPGDVIITGYPLEPRISSPELNKPEIQQISPTPETIGNPYPAPRLNPYPYP